MYSGNRNNLRFHVTYGRMKKIIEVASRMDINEAIRKSFKVAKKFDLQYFSKEFDDWVDVEELSCIPYMSKLLVIDCAWHPDVDADPQSFDMNDIPRPSNTNCPSKPSDTNGPSKPSDTNGPVKPSVTNGPVKPSDINGPSKPSDTNGPAKLSATNGPTKPSATNGPSKLSDTYGPAKLSVTSCPAKLSVTSCPTKLSITNGPSKPSDINNPSKPSATDGPSKPSDTNSPAKPPATNGVPPSSYRCIEENTQVPFSPSLFVDDLSTSLKSTKYLLYELSTSPDEDGTGEHYADDSEELEVDDTVESVEDDAVEDLEDGTDEDSGASTAPDWISNYKLPEFSKYVTGQLEVLKKTHILNNGVRRLLVTSLFQSIVCHTRYPTQHEYAAVLNLLMFKYPALKDRYSSKPGLQHTSWLVSLKNRFKEHRRGLIGDPMHDLMKKRYGGRTKRKASLPKNETLSTRCKKLRTSVNSIAENMGLLEDEFTIKTDLQAMKDALKENHPDVGLLRERLSRTFICRRKDILAGKPTKQILEDYPCLRVPEWILEEMNRITKVDLMDVLKNLNPEKIKKIKSLGLEKWSKITVYTKGLIEHDEVCWVLALHDLTNTSGFMYEKNPTTPYPAIIFGELGPFKVTFDNQTIENISSFSCALCCVLALYWVFNIDFPPLQKKFLTFLAKYIFGISGINYMPGLIRLLNSL